MVNDWVTIPEQDEWETITEETPFPMRIGGAFIKGGMRLGGALLDLPKHIVGQVKLLPMATMADEVLAAKDPKERATKLKDMATVETFFNRVTYELGRTGELHRSGQRTILKNHPEWESEPSKSFIDLISSPDKLVVALAESTPLLLSAGIMTAAGQPNMGIMMMYASEGQEAYDRAKVAGESDTVANDAYMIYGTVAAALENMQLQGIMKIGKGMFNRVLNRTVQKVGRQGTRALTMDIIKVAGKEALEEVAQGEWGDVTAKILYDEPFGDVGAHIDRRAQEAYIGFMMGVMPGAGGVVAGRAQRAIRKPDLTTTITDTHNRQGGSTIDPRTLRPVTTGFTAGMYPERGIIISGNKVSDNIIRQFISDNKDILTRDSDLSVGTWFDSKSENTYIDIVKNVGSPFEAIDIAQEHDQLYAWDNENNSLLTIEPINPDGSDVTASFYNYGRAVNKKKTARTAGENVWLRRSKVKSNIGRTLLVQFSSDLVTEGEDPRARAYYNKLYKTREGYKKFEDFWELPGWIGEMTNTLPNTDVYVVRNMDEAKQFLTESGYNNVAFSALDVNKKSIKQLGKSFTGDIIIGGEADKTTFKKDLPNSKFYTNIEQMAKDRNIPFKSGMNFHHFEDAESIPRLCMSKGCLHRCSFCTVPKGITEITSDMIDKQIESMSRLKAELVYIDDKTFGQAKNYKILPVLYKKLVKRNPEFKGFIIQTTASQMLKFDNKFLQDSGIRFIELGIETYNDPILKKLHKPATEKSIDKAVQKIRENGIHFIPNIMISLPGETSDTYQHTLDFLNRNSNIISHINIYNLALYKGTELSEVLETESEADIDENQIQKSFHKNPKVHENFADKLYTLASSFLDRPIDIIKPTPEVTEPAIEKPTVIEPTIIEDPLTKLVRLQEQVDQTVLRGEQPSQELRDEIKKTKRELRKEIKPVAKKKTRKQLLKQAHILPRKMGMTEVERRQFMKALTGMTSMKKMTPEQMQIVITAFKDEAIARGVEVDLIEPEEMGEPIVINGRATTMEEVVSETIKVIDDLPTRINVPKHIRRQFFRKIKRSGLARRLGRIFYGIDNSPLYELANILEQNKPGILTEVFDDNIQQGRAVSAGHRHSIANMFEGFCEDAGITRQDLAKISESCNPRMFHGLLETMGRGTTVHTIKINDRKYDMTPAELLDIYLIARQEDGLRHIYGGGLVVNGVKTGKISEETLAGIISLVEANPQLIQIVDIFTQIEEVWKETINNTSLTIEGREIATVENWWGLEVLMPKQLAGKIQKFNINLIENKSILKDRTKANNPLIIRDALQRATGFENAISEYVGFAQATRVARTLLNNEKFNELLRSKGYADVRNNIHTILERAQSVPPTSGSFDRFIGMLVPGVYRAVLFFNPRVVMSQYTSVTNYQAFVSTKYATLVRKGLSPEIVEKVLEVSDVAWDRFYMGHSSLELGELAASDATLRLLTKTSADKNKLGITLRISDIAALATGMEIATAEYKDAQSEKITGESAVYWAGKDISFKEGSTDAERVIVKRAEWLWHRSQPSWDKWSRSTITSDPSAIKRLFFLFRSFHEKSLTILHGAHTEYVNSSKTSEDKVRFAKKYGAVLSGYTLNTVLRAVIMAGLAFRIKDPFDYLKDIVTAPFAMLPILGHILNSSIRSFLNALIKHRSEYRGEAIESLPLEVINEIARAPVNFAQAAGYYLDDDIEKANKSLKRAVGQLYMGIGTAMGIPVYELNRIYKGWIKGKDERPKEYYEHQRS